MRIALIKLIFLFIISVALQYSTIAQVDAPELLCIKGDTVVWSIDPMPCGDFLAVDIYYSTNINGPYSLIASIMDIMEIEYVHAIVQPNRFYYLIARYDCPDGVSAPSDTLTNRPPLAAKVNFVTVENNGVRLEWEPSPSPQTIGYVVYRATSLGTVPIDTIFDGSNTYFDAGADPNSGIEYYYVLSMDACENTSGFDINHNTIFLEVTMDPCTREAILSWNDYSFFANGYDEWEIYVSIDGGSFVQAGTTPADMPTFVYEDLIDGANYCFKVEVQESGFPFRSISNENCFVADVIEPVRFLCLSHVTTLPDGSIAITWNIHDQADLEYLRILGGNSSDNVNEILVSIDQPLSLDNPGQLIDITFNGNNGIRYYRIETLDLCGRLVQSNVAGTLFLSGRLLPGRQNQIFWPGYFNSSATLDNYEVFRVENNTNNILDQLELTDSMYIDQISGPATGNTIFCYQLQANIEVDCDGVSSNEIVNSNVVCVEQNSTIVLPNAFVPGGANPLFKPVILYRESINNYSMQIFGRWGELLFETNDPDQGWDGQVSGRRAPMGSYAYYVRAVQNNGRVIEEKGLVTLVR